VPGLEVSPRLEAIAMRLMAKAPDARFQSATEVLEALDATADAGPVIEKSAPAAVALARAAATREQPLAHAETAPRTLEEIASVHSAETRELQQAPLSDPEGTQSTDEIVGLTKKSRPTLLIGAAIVLVTAAVVLFVVMGGGSGSKSQPSAAPVVDAGPLTMVTVDAGAAAQPSDAATSTGDDQAPGTPAVPPAKPRTPATTGQPKPKSKTAGKKAKKTPRVAAKEVVTPPDKTGKPPTTDTGEPKAEATKTLRIVKTSDLTSRYQAVGSAIERLASARGPAAAQPFRRAFSKIPFADALRKPALRREVDRDLRRLQSRVRRALKKSGS
jgi:hypothetical protein